MKKTNKNLDEQSSKKTELEALSDTNESNTVIDCGDEFVLFPLDVQETNPITQNSAAPQEDDFILFPLDVKKTTTTNNTKTLATKTTNKNTYKPIRQFVSKPNPQPVNINPQTKSPTSPVVTKPLSKKTKIIWILIICLGFYTYFKKESNETYGHFFFKTIKNVSISGYNQFVSFFRDEDDFIEFKKGKKIIVTVPGWNFSEQRVESAYFEHRKGDSIIIIELTKRRDVDRIEVKYMYDRIDDFKLNKIDTMWVLETLLNAKEGEFIKVQETRGTIPESEFDD
jgi:hypothetical protein